MISRISACNLLLPVITPIQLSKIFFGFALPPTTESNAFARKALFAGVRAVVGLGRLELPTSPLSGVRSNHLSYRPIRSGGGNTGGAGRDRTGDLLNANQALSQLSYSPSSRVVLPHPNKRNLEADWTHSTLLTSRKRREITVRTSEKAEIRKAGASLFVSEQRSGLLMKGNGCHLPAQQLPAAFSDSPHGLSLERR